MSIFDEALKRERGFEISSIEKAVAYVKSVWEFMDEFKDIMNELKDCISKLETGEADELTCIHAHDLVARGKALIANSDLDESQKQIHNHTFDVIGKTIDNYNYRRTLKNC